LTSHVLPKFVKRLAAMERPAVLDLGRVSGANIEFFGRIGCRLQIEDLITGLERSAHAAATITSTRDNPDESSRPAPSGPRPIPIARDAAPGPRPLNAAATPRQAGPVSAAATPRQAGPITPAAPGRRPRRHIVLPPRTFDRTPGPIGHSPDRQRVSTGGRETERWKSPLPTRFTYPDESFDAILAWDVFDFYDPDSARQVAAEVRRILKPGGLLLSFFHAARAEHPARPRRYKILDGSHFACEATTVPPMPRAVYQNRDIEKMFTGLRIVEQYFLKNSLRELLMEKKTALATPSRPSSGRARPKPRFRIE
jgi:SAM-dependent methyltransferase